MFFSFIHLWFECMGSKPPGGTGQNICGSCSSGSCHRSARREDSRLKQTNILMIRYLIRFFKLSITMLHLHSISCCKCAFDSPSVACTSAHRWTPWCREPWRKRNWFFALYRYLQNKLTSFFLAPHLHCLTTIWRQLPQDPRWHLSELTVI